MMRIDEWHPAAVDIFATCGLSTFDALWQCKAQAVESGNTARGGWSRVEKLTLTHQGVIHTFYIKKQQNYTVRSWRHFFCSIPTFLKEKTIIQKFNANNIPTLEVAYFGCNENKAILITWELVGYLPLDYHLAQWSAYTFLQRKLIVQEIARSVRHMHTQHWMHNCLYPKHIFIKLSDDAVQVAFIDLEKAKWVPCTRWAVKRDLDSLNRRSAGANVKMRFYFMKAYYAHKKWTNAQRQFIRWLAARVNA